MEKEDLKELEDLFKGRGFVPLLGEPKQNGMDYVGIDLLGVHYRFRDYDPTAISLNGTQIYVTPSIHTKVVDLEEVNDGRNVEGVLHMAPPERERELQD